ncbi:hypothetical protein HYX16_06545 [Candidatus Woesearchaeota archaeon]|nr:hypothetical protein [Candidatus Woesearchaeota archaeon]
MINIEDLIELNKRFDKGIIVNKSSLEFALSSMKHCKDWVKQLSYIVRALLIDHAFQEGNKRTAVAVILYFFESHKVAYDMYRVDKIITEIILKNINNIEKIRRLLKDVVR